MKKLLVIGFVSLMGLFSVAQGSDLVITSGAEKKTFYTLGTNLSKLLKEKPKVETSKGSMQNLEKLDEGKARIGFAFADSYALYIKNHPQAVNKLNIIGKAGKGCLYVAVNKNGKVKSEDDLQKEGVLVAVGKEGAGANATWDFAGVLDKDYKKPGIVYQGDAIALNALATQAPQAIGNSHMPISAVLQMQNPSVTNKFVNDVLANKNLEFIDFDDYSVDEKLPNGEKIYSVEKIDIQKGFMNDKEIKTICTDTLIIANSELVDDDLMEQLAEISLNKQSSILMGTTDE